MLIQKEMLAVAVAASGISMRRGKPRKRLERDYSARDCESTQGKEHSAAWMKKEER